MRQRLEQPLAFAYVCVGPMSKAFTKESDGDDDEREASARDDLAADFKNYITPAGYQRLHDELDQLWKVDRPKLVETIA